MAGTHPSWAEQVKAWGVHLFTASGIITVFLALLAGARQDFPEAMWWLLAAQFIDGVDGTLARYFRVAEVLPEMSGKSIDFVIDFAAYAIVPAFLIYQAEVLPEHLSLWLVALVLVASALYYGKSGMISADLYFVGFPVMWNMAAYFLIMVFSCPEAWNAAVVALLIVLQFVPIKFAYPSRTREWRAGNLLMSALMVVAVVATLWHAPQLPAIWFWANVAGLAYFAVFAAVASLGLAGARGRENN